MMKMILEVRIDEKTTLERDVPITYAQLQEIYRTKHLNGEEILSITPEVSEGKPAVRIVLA